MFALTVLFTVSMINSWNSRLIASYNFSYTVVHMKQKHSFTGTYGLGTGPTQGLDQLVVAEKLVTRNSQQLHGTYRLSYPSLF